MTVFILWQLFETENSMIQGVYRSRVSAEAKRAALIAEEPETLDDDSFEIDEYNLEN